MGVYLMGSRYREKSRFASTAGPLLWLRINVFIDKQMHYDLARGVGYNASHLVSFQSEPRSSTDVLKGVAIYPLRNLDDSRTIRNPFN